MITLDKYDAIIFDFGGVILDINPQRTIDAFSKGFSRQKVNEIVQSGILEKFEKGEVKPTQLINMLKVEFNINITDADFYEAWNAILLDYKSERIDFIKQLKKNHKLFLLSNTNEIHYKSFSAKLFSEYKLNFSDLFLKTYLSFEMGLIKPDKNIYLRVIEEQNLNPEKTLFIEDTEINAKAAETVGIKTLVIPRNGNFYDYFN